MRKHTGLAAAGAGVAAVLAVGGVAVASGGDDGGGGVTGQQSDRATEAALRATHGGTANSVERDGENGATWEVEVTTEHDGTVDVRLDDQYRVVVIESDSEAR
jgi:hypothetical protein